MPTAGTRHDITCVSCGSGDDAATLLLCDAVWHTSCLRPPLVYVVRAAWSREIAQYPEPSSPCPAATRRRADRSSTDDAACTAAGAGRVRGALAFAGGQEAAEQPRTKC